MCFSPDLCIPQYPRLLPMLPVYFPNSLCISMCSRVSPWPPQTPLISRVHHKRNADKKTSTLSCHWVWLDLSWKIGTFLGYVRYGTILLQLLYRIHSLSWSIDNPAHLFIFNLLSMEISGKVGNCM